MTVRTDPPTGPGAALVGPRASRGPLVLLVVGLVAIGVVWLVPAGWAPEVPFIVRLVHIISGVGWVGEVLTVNFVLLPALLSLEPASRGFLLQTVFPFVFRLATYLGGLAVISGATMFLLMTGGDFASALEAEWGRRILVGGILGAGLLIFHLVQESVWEGSLASRLIASADDPAQSDALLRRLRIAPRVGLAIILVTVILMSAAARLP